MLRNILVAALALSCLTAGPAFAHVGQGHVAGFAHGFAHPLSGLDHIIAMVAVGLYAANLSGRNLWLVPSAFIATMIFGGILGYSGFPLPLVEGGIGLSVVVMSLAVAAGVTLPTVAAMALVSLFALLHGHAHGSEGAELSSFLPYAAGFVIATTSLHVAGIGLGLSSTNLEHPPRSGSRERLALPERLRASRYSPACSETGVVTFIRFTCQ
jgi:urease accessory protein